MTGESKMQGDTPVADAILDLNFVPTWAKQPPTHNPYAGQTPEAPEGRSREMPPARRRERRPVPARPEKPARAPAAPAVSPPTGIQIHFIPERRQLGALVHRLRASRRAYPLVELARLLLSRPEFHEVKIECDAPAGAAMPLYQCRLCGAVYRSRSDALRHIASDHLDHWFEARNIEREPPTGQFPFVLCSPGGRLLGPPNHHLFAEALREAHETEAPTVPIQTFREQLTPVRDPEAIDQWKQSVSRTVGYGLRAAPDEPTRTRHEAQVWILENQAGDQVQGTTRAIVPATVASRMEDPALRAALQAAWAREQRFPMTMVFALRPALRHMGLHLFKGVESHTFVSAVAPTPLDPERAIPVIRDALSYLAAHPGCSQEQMVRDLFPGRDTSTAEVRQWLQHLHWLIDKGHVIQFFDGSLAVPRHVAAGSRKSPSATKMTPPPDPPSGSHAFRPVPETPGA